MLLFALLLGVAQASDACSYSSTVSTDVGLLLSTSPEPLSQENVEGAATASETSTDQAETPEKPAPLWEDFPYFYQYNNALHKGSSCQNTSVAMVLQHYGVDVSPDDITRRFGKDLAQSPEGLARVFNTYASEAGIEQRITAHRDGSMADLDALLEEGKPVILHGYFTSYGHVVVALGKTDEGYVVNDPAGAWTERFRGGYTGGTATNGEAVVYDGSSFRKAVGTSNGATPLPLWYHEITP